MTHRLANALLGDLLRLLRDLPPEAQAEPLATVDAFVAQPAPSRYLAAARTIRAALAERRVADAGQVLATRAFDRALAHLRDAPALDDAARATLASLPVDRLAAARLTALVGLLCAHDEMAARVRAPRPYPIVRLPAEPRKKRRRG